MRISEIFYSIQGEGQLTGVPSVFIRTSGCNLRCRWCDTKYASWDPEGHDLSLEEILARVQAFPARHCVLTGGEPMIARDLPALATALQEADYHVTIETAATVPPNGIPCHLASLSPKLSNATPRPGEIAPAWIERHQTLRLQPAVIDAWRRHCDYQLKFVVADQEDLREIDDLLKLLEKPVPPHHVLLMPEGLTPEATRHRHAWLVEACKQRGFRFCQRLHLDLFGNQRGT